MLLNVVIQKDEAIGLLQPLIQYTARVTRETATLTQLIKPPYYPHAY